MKKIKSIVSVICGALILFLTDSFVKNHIERKYDKNTKELFGGKIIIKKQYNEGFALGKCSDKKKIVKGASLFSLITAFLTFLYNLGEEESKIFSLGNAFMLGGALSNTYDRLSKGRVTDYIEFKGGKAVYNLSDFFIFSGVILVIFSRMRVIIKHLVKM